MPTDFDDQFATFAAPVLKSQFADREDDHEYRPISYSPFNLPSNQDAKSWPAILSPVSFAPVTDPETGETVVRETRTAAVETPLVVADGVTGFDYRAIVTVNEQDWNLDEATSRWDGSYVTFGLVGEPLVGKNELRRAAV